MYSPIEISHQDILQETIASLTHREAVARLASAMAAMATLDRAIERCTDPLAESCLLTLRVEHEVGYLKALFGWEYEPSEAVVPVSEMQGHS